MTIYSIGTEHMEIHGGIRQQYTEMMRSIKFTRLWRCPLLEELLLRMKITTPRTNMKAEEIPKAFKKSLKKNAVPSLSR